MGFTRSWVVPDGGRDSGPRSSTRQMSRRSAKGLVRSRHGVERADGGGHRRTSRGGAQRFDRSRYGVKPVEDSGRRRTKVRFDRIVPDPDVVPYPRSSPADSTSLARSIMEKGLKQPLLVWMNDGAYILVDGYRRYEALERVKETNRLYWRKEFWEVEVELVEGGGGDALVAQAKANRRTWNEADFATACTRMKAAGMSAMQTSERLGEPVNRILDAIEFRENAMEELVEATADGFPYGEACDLALKPEEAQRFAVRAFRHGKPKKVPKPPRKTPVSLGPAKLRPKRRNVTQIGEALDLVEQTLTDVVNDEWVPLHELDAAVNRKHGQSDYLQHRTSRIDELRGMRHALLWALGRHPDLLDVDDPVQGYSRGRRGGWFRMPSWRGEK